MNKAPLHTRLPRAWRAAMQVLKAKRGDTYAGAAMHRLLLDWSASARSANEEIKGSIRILRARARDLARNNAYLRRYFRMLRMNVVGPKGIRLSAQLKDSAGELDAVLNKKIESAWQEWAGGKVTVDGKLTLRRLEQLLLKTMACDGEAFVRIWRAFDGNRFRIALQPLDADLIDERYNRQASAGKNEIRMGIEVDGAGVPVGYWVSDRIIAGSMSYFADRYFVPADEMLHLYDPERVNQTRGVTWITAAMVPAHMLGAYEESEAVAARVAAAKMGFFEKLPDSMTADATVSSEPMQMEANPGSLEVVADGYTVKSLDWDHPTGQFGAFVRTQLRKIASAVNVFYNVLANDASGVTYSTMRSFGLVERDDWREIQQDWIELFRLPLFEAWARMSILAKALAVPITLVPVMLRDVKHRPRGWSWIDPEKEAKAAVIAIQNCLGTRTAFLAERGEDFEEVLRELAKEEELAASLGVSISEKLPAEVVVPEPDEDTTGGNGADRSEEVLTLATAGAHTSAKEISDVSSQ